MWGWFQIRNGDLGLAYAFREHSSNLLYVHPKPLYISMDFHGATNPYAVTLRLFC